MKNLIIIIFLLSSIFGYGEKKYIWLHGLEGDQAQNTWDIYSRMFTPNDGLIVKYKSNEGIREIAQTIYETEIKPNEAGTNYILIGHSMGGLVVRSIQLLTPSVKGMVTVGTGHFGSVFLQSAINGDVTKILDNTVNMSNLALDNSINKILGAVFPVSILAYPLVSPVLTFKNKIINKSLAVINSTVNVALNYYTFTRPCVRDMMPESSFMYYLLSKPITVPLVNVYGAEEHYQFLRAMGSMSRIADVKSAGNLDKTYDQEFLDDLDQALTFLDQVQNAHDVVYKALAYPAIFLPWIWVTRELVLDAKADWKKVQNYLKTGLDNDILYAMGSYEYRKLTFCLGFKDLCLTKYIPYLIDNDGILNRKEVFLLSGAGSQIFNVKVPNVNHLEMGNHSEIRKFFNTLTKDGNYGKVFVN